MAEIGLDSRRNGEAAQAESLSWHIAAAFEAGCAGAFVYAWTDEWFRGGYDIDDWDFGLIARDRQIAAGLMALWSFRNIEAVPILRRVGGTKVFSKPHFPN